MSGLRWLALSLVLPAVLAGCSGYRTAVVPLPGDPVATAAPADGPVVRPGTRVRVHLHDGRTREGQVTAITDEALVLGRPGNYGLAEETIPHATIARVEV
ncbi:MAG: hypothetical protein IH621_07275, partial [Krumholzibacteria bacterium]|nr:hypothetical protein [Candidatus Krumholzibacteria bacterium]